MSAHALRILEFGRALEYVAGFAATPMGRASILALSPASERSTVEARLEEVAEVGTFLEGRSDWSFPEVADSREAIQRLQVEGSVMAPADLAGIGGLLAAASVVQRSLAEGTDALPSLRALVDRLLVDEELERVIGRTVDPDGAILDTASKELGRIRGQLNGAHNRVVAHLESLLATVGDAHRVPDASVTIREGRYVIPVRKEGKGLVGGYVHDESSSGATVFIEPPSAIEMMNRVRELERSEAREIQRILRDLSDRCRPVATAMMESFEALAELDGRVARARAASRWRGSPPRITAGDLQIRRGRHPLLLAAGVDVVPFDIDLDSTERIVVVTGPNTGGKTVFLKSIGLISALAQSGVIPPVDPGTRLPVFDSFFADVGDGQSLAESLSTFSAHLGNLRDIVANAGPGSLVLIDELGTGTDPNEGEALARAIVERLAALKCTTIVTSHLGGLKHLAGDDNGIVNASLQFDADQMAPTYQFVKGRPGRSYGLAIARSLGFPEAILDLADAYRDQTEARVDDLLEDLQKKERRVSELLAELDRDRSRIDDLQKALEERETSLRQAERDHADKARADARRMLLEARREVEDAIAGLSARADAGDDLASARRDARRAVEEAARRLEDPAPRRGPPARAATVTVAEGVRVRVSESGAKGVVLDVEGDRALVDVGGVRLRVPTAGLEALEDQTLPEKEARSRRTGSVQWSALDVNPSTELDLRGQRVDEAEASLVRAVDEASLADLRELRVIHGKGTGALRERVTEILRADPRIEAFRPGEPGEGGHGVTVVKVR